MLRTGLAAMDAANKRNAEESTRDVEASTSVLSNRGRTAVGALDTGKAPDGTFGERPRREAREMTSATDLEVAKEHVKRRNPELKPQVAAHHSSAAEGVDGAASAWAADERNRALGEELSAGEEKRNAELAQAAKNEESFA